MSWFFIRRDHQHNSVIMTKIQITELAQLNSYFRFLAIKSIYLFDIKANSINKKAKSLQSSLEQGEVQLLTSLVIDRRGQVGDIVVQ